MKPFLYRSVLAVFLQCSHSVVYPWCVPLQGTLAQAVKKGHWILLDEINLAAAETLECLSGLLEGSAGSLVLLDRGDTGEDCPQPHNMLGFDISSHYLVCLSNQTAKHTVCVNTNNTTSTKMYFYCLQYRKLF